MDIKKASYIVGGIALAGLAIAAFGGGNLLAGGVFHHVTLVSNNVATGIAGTGGWIVVAAGVSAFVLHGLKRQKEREVKEGLQRLDAATYGVWGADQHPPSGNLHILDSDILETEFPTSSVQVHRFDPSDTAKEVAKARASLDNSALVAPRKIVVTGKEIEFSSSELYSSSDSEGPNTPTSSDEE